MKTQQLKDGRIDIYKWLKVGQCASMIVMGILFIVISILDEGTGLSPLMLSISLGIIASIYGVLDILAGYLLNRSAFNRDVIVGEVMVSLAIILFIKHDVINEILSYFFIVFFMVFSVMLVLYGIDLLVGKNIDKSKIKAILCFIFAAIMLAAAIVYLIFCIQDETKVEKFMLMIVGGLLIALGVFVMVLSLRRAKETKKALHLDENQQPEEGTQEKLSKPAANSIPTSPANVSYEQKPEMLTDSNEK